MHGINHNFWFLHGMKIPNAGEELRRIEKEKGIVIRFVIGHSAKPGGVLDKGIDAEDAEHQDFLRLNLIEGYKKLSTKTRTYFSTAFSIWDAEFYVKVDDDVHVNLGLLFIMKFYDLNFLWVLIASIDKISNEF